MARAGTPPKWSSRSRYYVSNHAIERLREWFRATSAQFDDPFLQRALDDAVHSALKDEACWWEVRDSSGEDAVLVHLTANHLNEMFIEGEVYALLKPDTHNANQTTIVTILTSEMVSRYYDEYVPAPPMNSLADKIKGVDLSGLKESEEKVKASSKKDDLTYVGVLNGQIKVTGARDQVLSWVQQHPEGKIFREVPLKVKIELDE